MHKYNPWFCFLSQFAEGSLCSFPGDVGDSWGQIASPKPKLHASAACLKDSGHCSKDNAIAVDGDQEPRVAQQDHSTTELLSECSSQVNFPKLTSNKDATR
ncbi:unnamed protein product [Durusdinium trenchii]|uniref:Uncharacterized protein n=1 Tax=Durusdinium trenchii TaxID=1381693 RepID=A0ABP0RJ89_9DINO